MEVENMKKNKEIKDVATNNVQYKPFGWGDCLDYLFRISSDLQPRVNVVLSMTLLEKLILDILMHFIVVVPGREKTLRELPASAKIRLIYYLGLIDTHHYQILDNINTIRNKFVHRIEVSNFDHEVITKKMDIIRKLKPIEQWFKQFKFGGSNRTLQQEFDAIIHYLTIYLLEQQEVEPLKIKRTDFYHLLQALKKLKKEKKEHN